MTNGANAVANWCLRFTAGSLKGRTIALKRGPNLVGAAGDCDVMLPSGDVLAQHVVVHVGELVVSVQRIGDAPVLLNGAPMQQPRRSAVAGDQIGLGSLALQLEKVTLPEPADSMFDDGEQDEAVAAPLQGTTVRRGAGFWTGLALLFVAIFGLLAVTISANNAAARASAGGGVSLAAAERAVQPFPEIEVVAIGNGQVAARGFVESHQRMEALEGALRALGGHVTLDVQAADDLVEQASRYVGDPGIAVSYAGHGRLVASGTAQDDATRVKLRRLGEELHPTVLLNDRVKYRAPTPEKVAEAPPVQWETLQDLLPARVVSITRDDDNGLRYIQLANGGRYYEGSILKSGAELQRIEPDGLVLSGGNAVPKEKRR